MKRPPGALALVASGCGTAIASVCALGLFRIERLVHGLWSVAAVLVGGVLCLGLARAFGRLATVIPSGAGLLAYLARSYGRFAGVLVAMPYLLLTLLLVGGEAIVVGLLLARLTPLPVWAGALTFLVGTWALCRAGVQVGYRAQIVATAALVGGLALLSLASLVMAARHGELGARLLAPPPGMINFVSAVGQALFLFMGFELVTSHAEVARSPRAIARGLVGSVLVLGVFYALVSAGFSCLPQVPDEASTWYVPQLAIAERAGGMGAIVLTVALSLLASFTSFNGALLGLSRLIYALAAQGMLPRRLGKLDAHTMVAREALAALLGLAIVFTALVGLGEALMPSILAAACAAAVLYAAAAWARERAPFREPERGGVHRVVGGALALTLVGVAIGVVADAGPARAGVIAFLTVAYGAAALVGRRTRRPRAPTQPSAAAHSTAVRPRPSEVAGGGANVH